MTHDSKELLALVDKIRGGTRDGWGYGREECAEFIRAAIAPQPGMRAEREAIKRAVCCPDGCQYEGDSEDGSRCYCDTSDYHGSGVEKRTNAVLAALTPAPVPPPDGAPDYETAARALGFLRMEETGNWIHPNYSDGLMRRYKSAEEIFNREVPDLFRPSDDVRSALEHAEVRFRCLVDHFKEAGEEALQAMSDVDYERMRKGLAALRSAPVSTPAETPDFETAALALGFQKRQQDGKWWHPNQQHFVKHHDTAADIFDWYFYKHWGEQIANAPAVGVTREAIAQLIYESDETFQHEDSGESVDGFQVTPSGRVSWNQLREMSVAACIPFLRAADSILALRSLAPDATVSDEIAPEQSAWLNERAAERRQMWTEHATHGGWQAVPKEPTKEMIQACIWALDRWREQKGNVQGFVPPGEKHQVRWRAMLAAAPSSPQHVGREATVDRSTWQWDKVAEAAYERAKLSDAAAAAKLRSAFRAIIEAGLSFAPVSARDAVIEEQK